MAAVMFDVGKQRAGINFAAVGGSGAVGSSQTTTRYMMTMSWDDGTVNFATTDTTLSTGGTPTNEFDQLLDGFATRSGQVITGVMTVASGTTTYDGLTIKRIALHDDVVATVTKTSNTILFGFDQLSLVKTAGVAYATTVTVTFA